MSTSIFQPFANKAHEGFLGHSFIASWVNLGAGTTTSNLKNNYSNVSVKWNGKLIEPKYTKDISSTEIRNRLKKNLKISNLVPKRLEKWLLEKKIY